MNLIFVITKNEIRTFRSNDGKTVSVFHISGEEIFEYDEYYDFAEDLKDKLLAIINMRDFSEVAVDIAYIKGEKRAAEEILREFIPCLRVQAVEFDKIDNTAEIAEKMLFITENKSVALEKELGNTKKSLAEAEQRIVEFEKKLERVTNANKILEIKYNELKEKNDNFEKKIKVDIQICDKKYEKERFCCYLESVKDENKFEINWKCSNGAILGQKYFSNRSVEIGSCKLITPSGNISSACIDTVYKENDIGLWSYGYGDASIKISLKAGVERKLIILKSNDIANKEIFAVITHPDDSEEAVKEWVKTKEGNISCEQIQTYLNERFVCCLKYEHDVGNKTEIGWNYSNGAILEGKKAIKIGRCSVLTPSGKLSSVGITTNYSEKNIELKCEGSGSGDIQIKLGDGQKRKLIILKSQEIKQKEIFAVITHPDDSEEAVKEWLKTKEGK